MPRARCLPPSLPPHEVSGEWPKAVWVEARSPVNPRLMRRLEPVGSGQGPVGPVNPPRRGKGIKRNSHK